MRSVRGLRSLAMMLALSFALAGCMQADNFETAMTASDQAFKDKQYDSAEKGYQTAVDFAEQTYHKGEGESDLIQALQCLAECYSVQNKFAEAEPQYLRAAQLVESKVGKEMMKTGKLSQDFDKWVSVLMSLADNYLAEGKFDDAEKTYKRVLNLEAKLTNPDKVLKAEAQYKLAKCYAKQGKPKDAVALFKTALSALERADGPRKQLVMTDALEAYAQTLVELKQTSEAEKLSERAKEMRAKLNVENK